MCFKSVVSNLRLTAFGGVFLLSGCAATEFETVKEYVGCFSVLEVDSFEDIVYLKSLSVTAPSPYYTLFIRSGKFKLLEAVRDRENVVARVRYRRVKGGSGRLFVRFAGVEQIGCQGEDYSKLTVWLED